MPLLDKYVEVLVKQGADMLLLRSGAVIELVVAGAPRPLSQRPATEDQIRSLLGEALGPAYTPGLDGMRTFPYNGGVGPVTLQVVDSPAGLTVKMQLAGAAAPPPGSRPMTEVADEGVVLGQLRGFVRGSANLTPPPASMAAGGAPGRAGGASFDPGLRTPAPVPTAPAPLSSAGSAPHATPGVSLGPSAEGTPRHMDELFNQMLDMKASDLHLKSNALPLLRVDGSMTPMTGRPKLSSETLEALLDAITPDRNRAEFKETNDTDFAYALPRARMRCNVFRDIAGVGAVFRQIPSKILTAEQLKLPKSVLAFCELDKGLVVVTGPTGSGKSTTLAAMVDFINANRDDHIITIEDPVEFVHPDKKCLINQREVGTQTKSFKAALRAALREDPDIVLVGEMRDLETVAIAIETAETGHLVFGTLHTNTAPSTVDRLIDQFPTDRQSQVRVMLSESLRGVVAQTLLKKKGGGRVAALEILIVTPAIANLIREGKTFQIPSLMQTGKGLGMKTLNDSLIELVKGDVVDPEEAFARAPHKKEFASILNSAGYKGSWNEPGATDKH